MAGKTGVEFPQTLDKTAFGMTTGTVSCLKGEPVLVGKHSVGFNERVAVGQGDAKNGVDTRETATIKIYADGDVQITDGKLRIIVTDTHNLNPLPIAEGLLAEWSAGKKLPKSFPLAYENGYVRFEVTTNDDYTIDLTEASTSVILPIMRTLLSNA